MKVYCLSWHDYDANVLQSVHRTWAEAYDAAYSTDSTGWWRIYVHDFDHGLLFCDIIGSRKYHGLYHYRSKYSRDVDPTEATP